jgi:hypothetical protein
MRPVSLAPRLKVLGVEAFEQPYRQRLPLRAGAMPPGECVQAFLRVQVRLDDGREGFGYAAEALLPERFERHPALGDEASRHRLRKAIEVAGDAYCEAPPSTAFDLYADNDRHQMRACRELGLPPSVAAFGSAVLDRAVLDALCRLLGASFWSAMRSNVAGMIPHPIVADVKQFDFTAFVAGLQPMTGIEARHRVGLGDPIVAADGATGSGVDDGLPETLEDVVEAYGQRAFTIELSGDRPADLDRLTRIAAVLDGIAGPLHVALDGQERFEDVEAAVELWSAMEAAPALQRLVAATLFIEQPVARQAAPARSVASLARHRPVVLDASDGEIDAFVRARPLGYGGVSSSARKGVYKAIVNLARCRLWNAEGDGAYFMAGGELATQAGFALQQDLALVGLLGLADVERSGHPHVDGFGGRPVAEAETFLRAHPDLYREDRGGVGLAIRGGRISLGSLDCAGFGTSVVPDLSSTSPMPRADWPTGSFETVVAGPAPS